MTGTGNGCGDVNETEQRPEPAGPPPTPRDCDLIMQGGVTSGVAYPAAIMQLYRHYRFRAIGGASAGAIAASITAAAEYARETGGFDRLDEVRTELRRPGLLLQLFAPTKTARPALRMLLAAQARRTAGAKVMTYLGGLLQWLAAPVLITVAAVFGVGWLLISSAGGSLGELDPLGWLVLAVLLLCTAALALVVALAVSVVRLFAVHLPRNYYGMCLGKTAPGAPDALTDWLHKKIQYVAGRSLDDPLTFADLAAREVQLKMMTTDVSWGRPVRMPDHARSGLRFLFDATELRGLFPDEVIDSMIRDVDPEPGHHTLRELPCDDMPVLLATRISLAFPMFLASVPLWSISDEGRAQRHWLSDGGLTSNFPIHFFDSWVPTRPTFGLNFVSSTKAGAPTTHARPPSSNGGPAESTDCGVGYYPDGRPPIRIADIGGIGGYLGQLLDAMHNWHDTMQAELPGFSDRIAHIELSDAEGGFNITMPPGDPAHPLPGTIASVEAKGATAGKKLAGFDFHRHWLDRYTMAMRMMQRNLTVPGDGHAGTVALAFPPDYRDWLAAGAPGAGPPTGRSVAWCAEAAAATDRLLREADSWLPGAAGSFVDGAEPLPPGVMRITPDV